VIYLPVPLQTMKDFVDSLVLVTGATATDEFLPTESR